MFIHYMLVHILLTGEGFVETVFLRRCVGLCIVYNTLTVPVWKKYPLDGCVEKIPLLYLRGKLVVVECQADIDKGDIQHVHRVVSFVV